MRILVYGAGNIGSLYAALLKQARHEVSILARGRRLAHLREHGIDLENSVTGERSTTFVDVVERLEADDSYDLVLVALPKKHVREVIPVLSANGRTPNILFMCNNAEGHGAMTDELGRERVLLGFPGAGAVDEGGVIRYLILSSREQPTTIGEVDGRRSPRIERIGEAFKRAGFPPAICPNMDAWLKTHAAEISPTANALFMAGGDVRHLEKNREALVLMIRAIREGYKVLRSLGIPITPANHRIFEWLPQWLLLPLVRRQLASKEAAVKVGHARRARTELKLLADEFQALARQTSLPTPAIDRLYQCLGEDAESDSGRSPEAFIATGQV